MNVMRYLICNAADEVNSGTECKLPQDLRSVELTAHQSEVKRKKTVAKNSAKVAREADKAMNLIAKKVGGSEIEHFHVRSFKINAEGELCN